MYHYFTYLILFVFVMLRYPVINDECIHYLETADCEYKFIWQAFIVLKTIS